MKINRDRLPVFLDHFGIIAISTGSGYVLLSALDRNFAEPIALILLVGGFVVRVVIKHRRKFT